MNYEPSAQDDGMDEIVVHWRELHVYVGQRFQA
jgi:hypothetical protein